MKAAVTLTVVLLGFLALREWRGKKERTINGSFFPFLPNDLLLIKKSENLIKLLDVEKRVKHSKKEQP